MVLGIKVLSLDRLMMLVRCVSHFVVTCYYIAFLPHLFHHNQACTVDPTSISTFWDTGGEATQASRLMGNSLFLSPQIRGVVTRCSTGCCWIVLSSRWSCRMTKVTTPTSHHWRILTWRTLSGCESSDFLRYKNEYMEQITLPLEGRMENGVCVPVKKKKTCAQQCWLKISFLFKFRKIVTWLVPDTTLLCVSSCLQAGQWKWSQTVERAGRENEKRFVRLWMICLR